MQPKKIKHISIILQIAMDKLFERHDEYLANVPMEHIRSMMNLIDWSIRLIAIKGPKGVGKSTLMLQYIKSHFDPDDRHVLYFSADTSYFATHNIVDTADRFCKMGGTHLFIDEIHKYENWSREIKEIYDLHKNLHVVISGSSLLQLNDGQADLSRRLTEYRMPGLSFREYLWFEHGIQIPKIDLGSLLRSPNKFCNNVKEQCHPLEHFSKYLRTGYYPFYFENKKIYASTVESVVNYIIDAELTRHRNLEVGNTRKIKALLQVISSMVPYDVDISKLSKNIGIQRTTTLKYLRNLEEASLIYRLFTNLNSIGDLQKPDQILLDNPNLLYALSAEQPSIGTVRETFFCNQLVSSGHQVEYSGLKSGDFRIDKHIVIEVGGKDKGFEQIKNENEGFVAADDIDSATIRKIPLWAFGCLY